MSGPAAPGKRPPSLGRGLSSLLGEVAQDAPVAGGAARGTVQMIPTASIEPHPGQPRQRFDEAALDELAASIEQRGVIQPIVVRPHGHRFQIVAGERRWRAAQRARLHEIPAIVRDFSDAETLEVALIENIQRSNLNAIEEAQAYGRLLNDYGHTQEELGKLVHKSRSHVANLLRLLDLPESIQEMVVAGALTMGHARALITAANTETLAAEVIRRGLSVRDTERLAKGSGTTARRRAAATVANDDEDLGLLERHMAELIGVGVTIRHAANGGTMTLHYSSLEQLDMLCQRLTGGPL